MVIFPNFRKKNKKYVSCHHPEIHDLLSGRQIPPDSFLLGQIGDKSGQNFGAPLEKEQ